MKTLFRPPASLDLRLWLRVPPCRRHVQLRAMSRSAEAHAGSLDNNLPSSLSFEDIGIRRAIVKALHGVFPNVERPTEMQRKFIPAVLSGNDVLLKDETGSGKSFGLVLALLTKPRRRVAQTGSGSPKSHITSLVIVPHRDLAYQFMHWIDRIAHSPAVQPPLSFSSIAQVVVRDGNKHLSDQLSVLRNEPPHILIGTPQALLDIHLAHPDVLSLSSLSAVVVDEVDYLVDSIPLKDKNKTFFKSFLKAKKKMERHPSATKQLLDIIYAQRKRHFEQETYGGDYPKASDRKHSHPLPQLIMSSATLRKHLDHFLFTESGWLQKDNLVKCKRPYRKSSPSSQTSSKSILHSAIVVTPSGDIKNIDGAIAVARHDQSSGGEDITPTQLFGEDLSMESDVLEESTAEPIEADNSRFPFNPTALEAIATAFALDVPALALLVLPASAPVQRTVQELSALGVNAQGLDLLSAGKGRLHLLRGGEAVEANPTLLVSTLATTRGIDLPHLTHVFILGIPEGPKITGRTVDAYLHIAGRVGRFGRGGRVVSVVEGAGDGEVGRVDEAAKMVRILREAGVQPVLFEHFD